MIIPRGPYSRKTSLHHASAPLTLISLCILAIQVSSSFCHAGLVVSIAVRPSASIISTLPDVHPGAGAAASVLRFLPDHHTVSKAISTTSRQDAKDWVVQTSANATPSAMILEFMGSPSLSGNNRMALASLARAWQAASNCGRARSRQDDNRARPRGNGFIRRQMARGTEPVGNVLIWTSEDGLADTIKPRLVRMGADLTRIKFIIAHRAADGKTRPFCPATDMPSLIEAAKTIEGGVALLIIDPIVAAIGAKINSHNNAETRNSLQPVVDFAEAANCAVLGISHFTKGTGGKDPIERVTGSLAFGALPRIVFAAAKTDETSDGDMPRIFVRAKSNIGPSGGGFGYDIDAAALMERPDIVATRIVWMEPIEGTARELLDAAGPQEEKKSKQGDAKAFLKSVLLPGEKRRQSEIEKEAKGNGFSSRTLSRAKTAAMVKSVKAHDGWWWQRD